MRLAWRLQLTKDKRLAATQWPRRPRARRSSRRRVLWWRNVATASELDALAEGIGGGGDRLAARRRPRVYWWERAQKSAARKGDEGGGEPVRAEAASLLRLRSGTCRGNPSPWHCLS